MSWHRVWRCMCRYMFFTSYSYLIWLLGFLNISARLPWDTVEYKNYFVPFLVAWASWLDQVIWCCWYFLPLKPLLSVKLNTDTRKQHHVQMIDQLMISENFERFALPNWLTRVWLVTFVKIMGQMISNELLKLSFLLFNFFWYHRLCR